MTYRLTGIVLRRRPIREADRLYTVYTRERGKVELLAQGTRKIQSKLAGTLETISILNIHAARGRTFDRLISAEVVESFPGITSASQISATLAAFALVDDCVRGSEQEVALFDLLCDLCRVVESTNDNASLEWHLDVFLWKLFPVLGYRPELDHCLRCASREEITGFDVHGGGILCDSCFLNASREGKGVRLEQESLDTLRAISKNDFGSLPFTSSIAVRKLGLLFLAMRGERPWPARNVTLALGERSALDAHELVR